MSETKFEALVELS